MEFRGVRVGEEPELIAYIQDHWFGTDMVVRGRVVDMLALPGLTAHQDGQLAGLVCYELQGDRLEILLLDCPLSNHGVGSQLIERVCGIARQAGCRRIVLITTNDNLHALGFYQRRGFDLFALHRNALERSRALKPAIPLTGEGGIPLRHEIELVMEL